MFQQSVSEKVSNKGQKKKRHRGIKFNNIQLLNYWKPKFCSGSSKSIHSNSGSSNSSGYGGLPATAEEFPQPHSSKSSSKNKDHKKKKSKAQESLGANECKSNDEAKDKTSSENVEMTGRNPAISVPVSLSNINNSISIVNGANNKSGNNNSKSGKNTNLNNNNLGGNVNNCETLHLATVAQALKFIKKMRSSGNQNVILACMLMLNLPSFNPFAPRIS